MTIKAFAQRDDYSGITKIGIRIDNGGRDFSIVKPMEFETFERVSAVPLILPYFIEGGAVPHVMGVNDFGEEFLRAMLNAAWDIGLRPDGFNDTREGMAAKDQHLQDMRAITFGKLGIEKP